MEGALEVLISTERVRFGVVRHGASVRSGSGPSACLSAQDRRAEA
jgi:hypothetical protein